MRQFRNKKKKYLRTKFDETETNNKIKNIWGRVQEYQNFNKSYHSRINIVKYVKGEMVADCHSILDRWRKHFYQLFNTHLFIDVRQTDLKTAELLVPEPRACEFELAIVKLKIHKSPGIVKPKQN